MSTRVKDDLFELIKSLSKSEKRYFKLYASRHTIGDENNYIKLFDAIDLQTEYNEAELFIHFKGNTLLNKFSITKKRLHNQILASLAAFYTSSSIEAQLFQMIQGADILYNKSLYKQAQQQLNSAQKLAEKHQLRSILTLIFDKQKKIIENYSYPQFAERDLHNLFSKESSNFSALIDYSTLWTIKSKLFSMLRTQGNSLRKEDLTPLLDELIQNFSNRINNLDFTCRYLYFHILSAYHFALNEFDESLKALYANLQLFDEYNEEKKNLPNKYFSILTNAIYITDRLGKVKESVQLFNQLKVFQNEIEIAGNEDLKIKLFSSVSSIEINRLLEKGEVQAAITYTELIQSKIQLYGEKLSLPRVFFFELKMAVSFFINQDYEKALKQLNRILNHPTVGDQVEMHLSAEFLLLITHFEKRNATYLNSAIKSLNRLVKAKKRVHPIDTLLLQLLSKLNKTTELVNQEQLFSDALVAIQAANTQKPGYYLLQYFDIMAWCEAKVKRKNMELVIQERYAKKCIA